MCFTNICFTEIDDYTSLQNAGYHGYGLVCLRTCENIQSEKHLNSKLKSVFFLLKTT